MNVKIEESKQPEVLNWEITQLVEYSGIDSDRVIVLTDGSLDDICFKGTNILTGGYGKQWLKQNFKPFNETVTLSND